VTSRSFSRSSLCFTMLISRYLTCLLFCSRKWDSSCDSLFSRWLKNFCSSRKFSCFSFSSSLNLSTSFITFTFCCSTSSLISSRTFSFCLSSCSRSLSFSESFETFAFSPSISPLRDSISMILLLSSFSLACRSASFALSSSFLDSMSFWSSLILACLASSLGVSSAIALIFLRCSSIRSPSAFSLPTSSAIFFLSVSIVARSLSISLSSLSFSLISNSGRPSAAAFSGSAISMSGRSGRELAASSKEGRISSSFGFFEKMLDIASCIPRCGISTRGSSM